MPFKSQAQRRKRRWWSPFKQGAEEGGRSRRSREIEHHRAAIGLHSDAKSKEPAAVTFGLDGSRDEGDRFSRWRKLETQAVGEILATFRTPHELH